jgi:hypothetical protein
MEWNRMVSQRKKSYYHGRLLKWYQNGIMESCKAEWYKEVT